MLELFNVLGIYPIISMHLLIKSGNFFHLIIDSTICVNMFLFNTKPEIFLYNIRTMKPVIIIITIQATVITIISHDSFELFLYYIHNYSKCRRVCWKGNTRCKCFSC